MTKPENGKHELIVQDLTKRLKETNKTSIVMPHFFYSGCEADVLQYWREHNTFFFNCYEVKSKDNPSNYLKAELQLFRFEKYIKRTFKGVLVDDSIKSYYVHSTDFNKYKVCLLGDNHGIEYIIGGI
jgi:hypothetical protein